MAYIPPRDITTVHGFPRYNAAQDFKAVSNVFNPDFKSSAGQQYLEGVGSLAASFIALGSLLFLVFAIVYGAACCCRHRMCKPVKRGAPSCLGKCCGCVFSPRLWYLGAVLCMVAAAAAGFVVLSKVQDAVNATVQGFQGFSDILDAANANVNAGLVPAVDSVTARAIQLALVLGPAGAPSAAVDMANALSETTESLSQQLAEVSTMISAATRTLDSALGSSSSQFSVSQLGSLVYKAGFGVLSGFVLYVVFSTLGLCGNAFAAKTFRGSLCVLVVALLLVWLFGAFFFTVSLIGSDVCVSPSNAVLSIVNVTAGTSDAAYTTTLYYTSPCGTVPPMGAYGQLASGQVEAIAALGNLTTLNATVGAAINNATVAGLLGSIDWAMTQVVINTNATVASVSCAVVYTQYLKVIDGLCSRFINSSIIVFGLATTVAILMIVMASAAASLAYHHPGDKRDESFPLVEDDSYLPMAYGGIPAAPRNPPPYRAGNYQQYTSLPARQNAPGALDW